ncbi:RNA polymerase recycling motor ATPase HelR [Nocardioides sp. LHD-245]|uniref:RNA polymerase recycling motor ATPase HelR n=1 Tax=Nocardioides sp. LHD-245 TaxID=3051387 RepID=UPI0027DFB6A0|nr:RNA polymerase recycling motor ATPase HelR [Nocardioides sp. LHD-245]
MGADELTDATTRAFDLQDHPAKDTPALVADDEAHFAAIGASLERTVAELEERLADVRRQPGGTGQEAMDRDLEVHRLSGRLKALRRYRLDLCLGRMVAADGETVHVGRFGLTDADGRRLLVDWRSPAAEPFFGATHGNPMGLASRRRYRWTDGRVSDYWDEVFTADALDAAAGNAALDDQSAFVASLGNSRSARMRDVLATIQADQDAIVRAGSRGTLVVDGGPGTGKTVVALHRAAYLLYADPRLGDGRGGVLFVGPHQPYLAYVGDVLPSLGEEGVRTCTVHDLVAEGRSAVAESDPEAARLKADVRMVGAIEPAVRLYEEPPTEGMVVETDWSEVWLGAGDWAEAFGAPDPGTPHNEARDQVWEALLDILVDKHEAVDASEEQLRRSLRRNGELAEALTRAWPMIEPTDLVGDLWEVPAYLRHCAPWLSPDEVRALRRTGPQAWTVADLPLLDLARARLGDPDAARARRRQEAEAAAEREEMDRVVDHLVASDDSDLMIMSMLRGADLRGALAGGSEVSAADPGRYAGPFAHVVVDEAQELTDAEWQMLLRRCPSRSFTVVGDRAQARHGFVETWAERLERVGLRDVELASLTVNYRTPAEVMAAAAPVVREVLPDANVPTSIRSTGVPVQYDDRARLATIVAEWLAEHDEGVAAVIGDPGFAATARVRSLSPAHAKGLEFDLVVLVAPDRFGTGIEGAVDRYVAMTRATQRLVVLS